MSFHLESDEGQSKSNTVFGKGFEELGTEDRGCAQAGRGQKKHRATEGVWFPFAGVNRAGART